MDEKILCPKCHYDGDCNKQIRTGSVTHTICRMFREKVVK